MSDSFINQELPLLERRAMITGSTRGIGRAIAEALAAAGADVLIHGRSDSAAAREAVDAVIGHGRKSALLIADLSEPANHERLVQQVWDDHEGVDIWINNAGADVLTSDLADASFEQKLDALWRVDVVASVRLSRLAGSRMKRSAKGPAECAILNMGWDQAEWGMAGDAGQLFGTIKGAVMAFTRSLARTLAPEVRVNCLAPGWIKTEWGNAASGYWQARAARECLLRRWGTPDDVARVARFLVSPDAHFINGQIIQINGGFDMGGKPVGEDPR